MKLQAFCAILLCSTLAVVIPESANRDSRDRKKSLAPSINDLLRRLQRCNEMTTARKLRVFLVTFFSVFVLIALLQKINFSNVSQHRQPLTHDETNELDESAANISIEGTFVTSNWKNGYDTETPPHNKETILSVMKTASREVPSGFGQSL